MHETELDHSKKRTLKTSYKATEQPLSGLTTTSDPIPTLDGTVRSRIRIGSAVRIVLKADQRSGKLTDGIVARILTNSPTHPHGIKVMLEDGQVGRVQVIVKN